VDGPERGERVKKKGNDICTPEGRALGSGECLCTASLAKGPNSFLARGKKEGYTLDRI